MDNSLKILFLPVELFLRLFEFDLFTLQLILKLGISFERVKLKDILFIVIEIHTLFSERSLLFVVLLYLF